MNIVVGAAEKIDLSSGDFCGVMVQYPNTYGGVHDWSEFTARCHANDALVVGITGIYIYIYIYIYIIYICVYKYICIYIHIYI
jgi:glycine cleavage system pyridoxal-binding protein P